jgi:quercetin dioxygenase-like cupin family protein
MDLYIKNIFSSMIIFLIFQPAFTIAQEADLSFTREADEERLEWGQCPEFMPESCRVAVLQGDPAKPNADVFFKMQGNTTAPEHWHHSAERMVVVSGKMKVNYEGQDPEIITEGTYAYGPPEKPHSATCMSEEPCILFIAFSKPFDAFPVD